jgi:signal transduction histidine kinase
MKAVRAARPIAARIRGALTGRSAGAAESPLVRQTRWRLIAWSGGTTLIVLLVLSAAIYVAAATSLASAGEEQLRARLNDLSPNRVFTVQAGAPPGALEVTSDPANTGVLIGGEASGTIAFVLPLKALNPNTPFQVIEGGPLGETSTAVAGSFPDPAMLDEVRAGRTSIREASLGTTPIRVLAAPVITPVGMFVAVVIGDRTSEVGTLQTLLVVLLGGGLVVLAAAIGFGYVYAGRALVPIRESLRRQREFAADASHELRTPLTITRAAIAELARGRDDPAVVERALGDLDAGTTRLEQLVGDLLVLARTDAEAIELTPVATDLANLAAEATESLEPVAATRGVRLVLDIQPAPIEGDEVRIRQLVAILVDNAIRHSPDRGRVVVAVRPGATLSVEDDGPGLRTTDMERVFERFWRAPDAPSGGTGLGLAIARWIVERHRGSIVAANRQGGPGARFVVRMPAA